jgi:glycosyltransferase involved in cell wall biosynthesis
VSINLIEAFCDRRVEVDVLLGKVEGPWVEAVDGRACIIPLGTSHGVWSAIPLAFYMARARPQVLVTDKLRANVAALRGRRLAGSRTAIFAIVHGMVSHKVHGQHLSPRKSRAKERAARRNYPQNDGVIAVSSGVAEDLISAFSIPANRVHVVPNPVVSRALFELSREQPDHRWLASKDHPVIAWVGRLVRGKGVRVMLRALRILRERIPCRLILIGDGSERSAIEGLIGEWGLGDCVSTVGFQPNPFNFMARCDLLALTSAWEGLPTVLIEAMALGVPMVSTDCPVGPREILDGGRLGRLVPVGDEHALADAIAATLAEPPRRDELRAAAERYTAEACVEGYLRAFGIEV